MNILKSKVSVFVLFCTFSFLGFSQTNPLKIPPENIKIMARGENEGFDLYVKKTGDVNSILLTESIRDYAGNIDSYAYRATEYNPVNGDEIRYLNGQILNSEWAKYSLVDSTPEDTEFFGPAFHIYIPPKIVFGYEWARKGEVKVGDKTFINIRAFSKKYADHSGAYFDSPYYLNLKIVEKPKPVVVEEEKKSEKPSDEYIADHYNVAASDALAAISDDIIYCSGPYGLVNSIMDVLNGLDRKRNLDVVFAIDGTGSMDDDLYQLKQNLVPMLMKMAEGADVNFGLLYYRDYEDYVSVPYKDLPVHIFDFGKNLDTFLMDLNSITAYGGGDTPEAVYEAIYAAVDGYQWREKSIRKIILIGDAEPHPEPRGSGIYSKEYVMRYAKEKDIKVTTILLP